MYMKVIVLILALASVVRAQYGDQEAVSISFKQYDWTTGNTSVWSLVHFPDDYETSSASTRYPILIFFHGAGQNSPNKVQSDLSKITSTYGPCKEVFNGSPMEYTVGGVLHKFITVCPQNHNGWWDAFQQRSMIDALLNKYNKINLNRVYLTGISAGGWSTMQYIATNTAQSSRIAAYVPVSADVPEINKNGTCHAAAARVPLWSIYAESESLGRANRDAVQHYNNCPNKTFTAIGTAIPGAQAGHNAYTWNRAYATDHTYFNPNIYEWMLQYQRPNLPVGPTSSPTTPAPTSTPPTPAPTPSPCPAAIIGSGIGLRGVYYNGTNFDAALAVRTDATINFAFGTGAPPVGAGFPADRFTIRWTGSLRAKYTGVHSFTGSSDNAFKLTIGSTLVVDDWVDHSLSEKTGTYSLVAGQSYPIVVEFRESTGSATVSLSWQSACLPKEIIPATQFTPSAFSIC